MATLADIAHLITGNKPFNTLRAWLIWNDGNISPVEIHHIKISSGSYSPIFIWTADIYGNTIEETMIHPVDKTGSVVYHDSTKKEESHEILRNRWPI